MRIPALASIPPSRIARPSRPPMPSRSVIGSNPAPTLYALRFPSNVSGSDQAAPYAVIRYDSPHTNGLPAWGPGNAGVTYIRKVKGIQHTGYFARLWYTRNDTSFDGACYGIHPYPTNQSNSGTTHIEEIAAETGDWFDSTGSPTPGDGHTVTQGQVYTQALRCTYVSSTSHVLRYYFNLPNVSSADYIERTITGSGFMDTMPNGSQLVVGDSPWFASFQHERFSGDLWSKKVIAKALSEADIVSEAANMSSLVTSDGLSNIWWGKKGFTSVDDLTCDYGTGRSWTRSDSSNLITLVAAA